MSRQWLFFPAPLVAAAPEPIGFGYMNASGGSTALLSVPFRNLADDADQDALADDLVVAQLTVGGTRTLNVPTDWTELVAQAAHSGANIQSMLCYRRLPSSQSSQEFTISGGATQSWNVACAVIRGSNVIPINQQAGFSEGTSATPTCPTLMTTVENCLILRTMMVHAALSSEDDGYPASHTGLFARTGSGGSDTANGMAVIERPEAGAVGTAAWSTPNQRWLTATVAVKP